jgi:hypothetical protein
MRLVHCTKICEIIPIMLVVFCSHDTQNFTLVYLIIDRSLAEVNVSCALGKFGIEIHYYCLKSLVLIILIQNFTIVHLVIIEHSLAEVKVSCTLYQVL